MLNPTNLKNWKCGQGWLSPQTYKTIKIIYFKKKALKRENKRKWGIRYGSWKEQELEVPLQNWKGTLGLIPLWWPRHSNWDNNGWEKGHWFNFLITNGSTGVNKCIIEPQKVVPTSLNTPKEQVEKCSIPPNQGW